MNKFILKFVDRIYLYIFGYPMGERARKFVENLGIVMIGFGGASILSFVFTVTAGRLLGPEEYGKANLVLVISNFIFVPIAGSIATATIKYLAQGNNREKIITSSLQLVILFSILSGISFYLAVDFLSKFLKIDSILLYFSLFYALIFGIASVSQSILKGLKKFATLSILNLISAILFGAVLVLMFSFHRITFDSLVSANISRWVFIGIVPFLPFMRALFRFDREWLGKIFQYSMLFIIGALPGSFLFYLNHLMINYFFDIRVVGIYSAYFFVSTFITFRLLDIFLNVFSPEASSLINKKELFLKLVRFFTYTFVPIFVSLYLIIFIGIKLFGRNYPLDFLLITLFSFTFLLFVLQSVFGWFMAFLDLRALRFAVLHAWGGLVVYFLSAILFIRLGIYGAVLSLITSFCYLILVYLYYLHRRYREGYGNQ